MAIKPYEIRRITIDPANWTPVITPNDCNTAIISRGSDNDGFKVRTDPNDALTEKQIASGWPHTVNTDPGNFLPVFPTGTTICWVLATSLAGSAVVEFIR